MFDSCVLEAMATLRRPLVQTFEKGNVQVDTPLIKRAYNLGLKAVPNFTTLSEDEIAFYEGNLDQLPVAVARGFIVPEPVLDFIVRVDRSVKPSYPNWMKKLMHPELELAGPAEYNLQDGVEQWLHDDQKRGYVVGNTIYKHLQKGDGLANCLNLQDGLAIQQKGIAVFRKLFAGKAVFLWGSVVQRRDGFLHVPYLYDIGGKVGLYWNSLDYNWYSDNPALRFSK